MKLGYSKSEAKLDNIAGYDQFFYWQLEVEM